MMIHKNIEQHLPLQNLENVYVVADFDRTITQGSSKTSWSILAGSNLVPKSYIAERQKLYDIYRPIELDETMDFARRSLLMKEWFQKHIALFVKYQMSEEIFNIAATDLRIMQFRSGAKEFLTFLHKNQIPLIIISAGIGNFIETFLKHHDCYFDNIYISSNKILFKDGFAYGVEENIIHSLNKNEVSLPHTISGKLQGRNHVVLLGDQVSDLKMIDKSSHDFVVTVGFTTDERQEQLELLKNNFDIVCEENDNYFTLKEFLF